MNCTPVLLGSSSGNGAGRLTVEDNVVAMKKLSRDFNTPVIVISSLNRASYDKEIAFEAFRESSSIEYSCDLLIGLQFEMLEAPEGEEAGKGKKGKAKFDINEAKRKDVRDTEFFTKIRRDTMSDTQSIDPVKLEWRSYGAHYKCDMNINEVVLFWRFACGNDYFVPVVVTPLFKPNFHTSKKLEDAMNVINGWNNALALCGYSIKAWLNKSCRITQ